MQARAALRGLAEKTGGRYITDPGGARMYKAFEEVVEELSHQYTIGYFPAPEKLDGKWHKLDVRLSKSDLRVRTRQGYRAPKK
jgi:VWFA-related protein